MAATGRIVVFGATGYTGTLVSDALVERGARPVLAARNRDAVEAMAGRLGGLETLVADVSEPASVRSLVDAGDVLVSTVGPFLRFGRPAAEAAAEAGAHYLDSTGEPPFIREVFERHGPIAASRGAVMLTAFGYDFVPGNLAGALALRDAGEAAVRVDVGYFFAGRGGSRAAPAREAERPSRGGGLGGRLAGMGGASGGTLASLAGVLPLPAFAYRDRTLVTERSAARVRTFEVDGRDYTGFSVGASEHFGLPAAYPRLREVNAYLGWFGPLSRAVQISSLMSAGAMRLPGGPRLFEALADRVKTSTGGPSAQERERTGSLIVATVHDQAGAELARVVLRGVNGYTFTGRVIAWGATEAAAGALRGTGALGPVEAFGLDELEEGCASAGLSRVVDG